MPDSVISQALPFLPSTSADLAWTALVEDSGADVAIVSTDGRVHYSSPMLNWWALPNGGSATIGKTLHELFTTEFADERLELIRRVSSSQRTLVLYGIWRGVRTRTVIRPLLAPSPSKHPGAAGPSTAKKSDQFVLMVCRGFQAADRGTLPTDAEEAEAKQVDHGKLGVLTPRELEILQMIAQGMTTAAIAKVLFRSRKTIEAHRLSIGAKLGARNRVELARIALEAGLLQGQPGSHSHVTGRRYARAHSRSGAELGGGRSRGASD